MGGNWNDLMGMGTHRSSLVGDVGKNGNGNEMLDWE